MKKKISVILSAVTLLLLMIFLPTSEVKANKDDCFSSTPCCASTAYVEGEWWYEVYCSCHYRCV